jgi:hypothetical protein
MMISPQHASAHGGRYVLCCALGRLGWKIAHVSTRKPLCVALHHLARCRRHFERLAVTSLSRAATILADIDRHLIARASFVRRPTEHMSRQQEQDRVIIQMLAGLTA